MTGGSLGLRLSGSFSSLEHQLDNGGLHHQIPYLGRRQSKTSLPIFREKDRFHTYAFRYLCRKKVGVLFLVGFALVAFMTGFFTVNKEDDMEFDYRHINKVSVCDVPGWNIFLNASAMAETYRDTTVLTPHPCKNSASPPPPPGAVQGIGPRPCPVCYLPVEEAIARIPRVTPPSPILQHLTYLSEENPLRTERYGGSDFGGYPSLKQRTDSLRIDESMAVHCGFVRGCKPGYKTGFDIDMADLFVLEQFYEIIVASAVFGNYDPIHQPENISEVARRNIPFFMFVDEETETTIRNSSLWGSDTDTHFGLWRIIVVRNVPYMDARRNGKVPKLLLHRLFPNTRYSLWIDGKLKLLADPYQILDRFLWSQSTTFAISNHYRRFDVFEEAEANKVGGKYDNASIDYQIEFYKKEGLTPYTPAKLPITSDVPEGCVLIREHVPITNLFSCLWFNEVDRFTSRDQLSFSTVRDKIQSQVNWSVSMFQDCERRDFVKQEYHRDVLEQKARMAPVVRTLPPRARVTRLKEAAHVESPPKITLVHRGREKKPGSRRRRKATLKNRGSASN